MNESVAPSAIYRVPLEAIFAAFIAFRSFPRNFVMLIQEIPEKKSSSKVWLTSAQNCFIAFEAMKKIYVWRLTLSPKANMNIL